MRKYLLIRIVACGLLMQLNQGLGQFRLLRQIDLARLYPERRFTLLTGNSFGDFYLIDQKNNEVCRVDSLGRILNRNGGIGWEQERFERASDLCVISGTNVIVADFNNHRLVRFDRNLNFISELNLKAKLERGLYPMSVTASRLGDIYILSGDQAEIVRIGLANTDGTGIGGRGYGKYALERPVKIRYREDGTLIALEETGRMVVYDRFGTPRFILNAPARDQFVDLVLIGKDLLIIGKSSPHCYLYDSQLREWLAPPELVTAGGEYIAGFCVSNRLYLLSSAGRLDQFIY